MDEKGKSGMERRIEELKLRLNQARNLNTKEVEAEVKRSGIDVKAISKKKRTEARRKDKAERKALKESGAVFVERRVLSESAGVLEEREERKGKKRAAPEGEVIFGEDNLRQAFEKRLESVPEYSAPKVVTNGSSDDLAYGQAPSIPTENVDKMVQELEATTQRREKFSRRRAFLEDEIDVDFINERNRKFNNKISRAFDKYTADVKQSLERGTSLP
ncbi:hypothetical protein NDN08_006424 [Rhodosorus marinus]|uniref:Pre-mRNA-splicing factor SYF2 n=1 Tax=Rhodosorus marinus TaxID=101924 RepID=A0AAV8UKN5_9RHOD|nr:hypothetical protein NDN08_006424 [Rhodosorus marinus]